MKEYRVFYDNKNEGGSAPIRDEERTRLSPNYKFPITSQRERALKRLTSGMQHVWETSELSRRTAKYTRNKRFGGSQPNY